MPPGDLDKALCGLDLPTDPNLLVGLERADDAGVYRVTDDIAIIQTVDFFTPVIDDPFEFGRIAAANALSDVYAMGGVPKTAMNLVGFPLKTLDLAILRKIIEGGLDKMREADVVLVGGHSVQDKELKYGLSVTGFVHPDKVLTKHNLQPGDRLILTKPIGTGIINTAIKRRAASPQTIANVTATMATLNRRAAETMAAFPVNACTDVTGFGLLGHLAEMLNGAGVGVELMSDRIPLLPDTLMHARRGMVPGGVAHNRKFREHMITFRKSVDPLMQTILFDPQTSGGLLISVAASAAEALTAALIDNGVRHSAIIGQVVAQPEDKIVVN